VIVDCAIYDHGKRTSHLATFDEALAGARNVHGFVWIGLHDPEATEFERVAAAFGLHPLAVEDAIHAHQRPKLERYGDSIFVVLKPARYVDSNEVVELGQIMVFLGRDFVVTVRHGGNRELASVRRHLEADPDRLAWGPAGVLHAIADRVVDDYDAVMRGLEEDIDEIEGAVFSGPQSTHAERIFKLKREVLDFRRAVEPLEEPLQTLAAGVGDDMLDRRGDPYFRDVHDHVLRIADRLTGVDALLDSALSANVAQVGMRQNEDMRKISAWVAILAVPTMIAGIYGMNFEHMPELESAVGYPAVLATMALVCYLLYRNFKRRHWL
jgi:magnesium transporter